MIQDTHPLVGCLIGVSCPLSKPDASNAFHFKRLQVSSCDRSGQIYSSSGWFIPPFSLVQPTLLLFQTCLKCFGTFWNHGESSMWRFPKIGVPLVIIYFSRIFPYKPSSYGASPILNPPKTIRRGHCA